MTEELENRQNQKETSKKKEENLPPVVPSSPPAPQAEETQVEVVGIRFRKSGKIYYFSPGGISFDTDSHAIVETARGVEYGSVAVANRMVSVQEIVPPLRTVLRRATPEDDRHHEENGQREVEAFNICVEKIAAHQLVMKLVDVEYTFDNNKLLFYFTAEGRVDFRELVKDLASVFRTRIELRQIGIRDEAKLMGGLGVCGRPFCCHSFLSDFMQVSIKMAKEQNLSLNSTKISGTCGRLMCCLRYENDVYEEEMRKTPRPDTLVETPDGEGTVTEALPLQGCVKVRSTLKPDLPPKLYKREDVRILRRDPEKKRTDAGETEAAAARSESAEGTREHRIPVKLENNKKENRPEGTEGRRRDFRGERRGGQENRSKSDGNRRRDRRGESAEGGSGRDRRSGNRENRGENAKKDLTKA